MKPSHARRPTAANAIQLGQSGTVIGPEPVSTVICKPRRARISCKIAITAKITAAKSEYLRAVLTNLRPPRKATRSSLSIRRLPASR